MRWPLEMLSERSDPKQDCCQLTGKSEKGAFGHRFRGSPWDELLLPIAPRLPVLWGFLEFRRKKIHSKQRFEWVCPKEGAHWL